ncbi:hypothetical protein [Methylobacterium sp. GC_Met_2]|uniref:hypothetical protein n=1 Tax=Methylobacterium sp. GC_Met_2 TaxID=2937376 RepID=UPI00226B41C9|nr:hypothetical protein [Methylobacterium sp. GC_Met_2]
MSAGLSFGGIPAFADLSPDQQAMVMQALQGQGQPANAPPAAPSSLLGQVDPKAADPAPERGGSPVAMSETDTRRMEQAMASPQDRAALGSLPGSPDALLYDRAGMGGGVNPFGGSADPSGQRNVPLPPQRPSEADLLAAPTATGSVSGTNPGALRGQLVATSAYHPNSPGTDQAAPGSTPTGGYPGGAGEFDPLTGQRLSDQPRSLGTPQGAVSPSGAATATGQAGGAGAQPGFMDRFINGLNSPDGSNFLRSLSIGLLTQRGIGPAVGAAMQHYDSSQAGSLKNQLEQVKFLQQQQGAQATYGSLRKAGFSHEQATAGMYNPTMLTNLLAQSKPNLQTIGGQIYDLNKNGGVPGQGNLVGPASGPPAGYRLGADGQSLEFIPGSEADPAVKERNAKAVATDKEQTPLLDIDARRKVGIPDNDTRAAWADPNGKVTFNDGPPPLAGKPGTTFYDRGTQKPILTVPSAKPDGFDTETKLRGEFSKQLGTFADVHDGYGRLIAATKQRQENPGSVSPASDISLVFGYMKMLDPGSVVREGEYATAKNAAGVPERVLNAYNKALTGEFLSDTQRKDFLGQASELYGTARKTAEGVAERYRNLATSYGADPSRAVYLPEMPTPPKLGQQGQTAPVGGAAARYQSLIQGGMSKADAFAQMHKEGL